MKMAMKQAYFHSIWIFMGAIPPIQADRGGTAMPELPRWFSFQLRSVILWVCWWNRARPCYPPAKRG